VKSLRPRPIGIDLEKWWSASRLICLNGPGLRPGCGGTPEPLWLLFNSTFGQVAIIQLRLRQLFHYAERLCRHAALSNVIMGFGTAGTECQKRKQYFLAGDDIPELGARIIYPQLAIFGLPVGSYCPAKAGLPFNQGGLPSRCVNFGAKCWWYLDRKRSGRLSTENPSARSDAICRLTYYHCCPYVSGCEVNSLMFQSLNTSGLIFRRWHKNGIFIEFETMRRGLSRRTSSFSDSDYVEVRFIWVMSYYDKI